jgi:uncharacterized membrane protein YkgB
MESVGKRLGEGWVADGVGMVSMIVGSGRLVDLQPPNIFAGVLEGVWVVVVVLVLLWVLVLIEPPIWS